MKSVVAKLARRCGLELHRAGTYPVGRSPFRDAQYILGDVKDPCIFDVGANVGQTLAEVLDHWPEARVHCFEPAASTLAGLNRVASGHAGVKVNSCALGATSEEREFHEYDGATMHSFLLPGQDYAGVVTSTTRVQTDTLDEYCRRNQVDKIDVLKIDTQGFDLEVLKGAASMLEGGKITMILIELNFAEYYQGQVPPGALIDHILSKQYLPLCFYPMIYRSGHGSWCDAMFLHRSHPIPSA